MRSRETSRSTSRRSPARQSLRERPGRSRSAQGRPPTPPGERSLALDVQRIGREFKIPAIATDRYRSSVSGTFDVTGIGGGRYPLTLDVTGTLVDSQLVRRHLPAHGRDDASGRRRTCSVKTAGTFAGLDPAVVTGERARRRQADWIDRRRHDDSWLRRRASPSIPSIPAATWSLAPSTIGRLTIDSAVIDGSYANREGQLKTARRSPGPIVNVTGKGAIALNDTGASNLTLHADTPSLDRVGEIIGQPLKGAAVVDATVTGNARELKAAGTLTGSNVGTRRERGAEPDEHLLGAPFPTSNVGTGAYPGEQHGHVPRNRRPEDQRTHRRDDLFAVAPRLQGRWRRKAPVELARRRARSILHPDHQEIHVGDLALRSEQIEWRTPAGFGRGDSVREGSNRGREPAAGERRPANHRGRRDRRCRFERSGFTPRTSTSRSSTRCCLATGGWPADSPATREISGYHAALQRHLEFHAVAGRVPHLQVRIADRHRRLHAERRHHGRAPAADADGVDHREGHRAAHAVSADASRRGSARRRAGVGGVVDVQIASSPIDLGLVQGFTPYVTNVTGTLQANVRVTGTGYDPHVEGAIDVRGGAFAIPELGHALHRPRHPHRFEAGRASPSASSRFSTTAASR